MVRNLLDGLPKPAGPRHVALMTGLKHYLGPFETYGKGGLPQTPFREEQGRLDVENFYYAQEDEVFAAVARAAFSFSTGHRCGKDHEASLGGCAAVPPLSAKSQIDRGATRHS
jgi:hypothetical protein